ncbi:MAG: YfhO family protein, partial [Oscillospiraceae bacterium]|nr:YfhO family protein [Oscillospiraceae bacterium]
MLQGEVSHSNKWVGYLTAFLLPSLLILSVFVVFGVFPFGEKSLLVVDMNSEYIDYFAYMHDSVRTGGSFLRSWNMGMGLDMLGLIAFYTASPFNIILLLMPATLMTEAVLIITVLKIGAAGLLFFIYAQKKFQLPWLWVVVFSTIYALIGYNLYYSSNIMWLDGVAFLPVALLGVEGIIKKNRFRLFAASLIYIFVSSYYIGYMIGVFSVLYMTAVYFSKEENVTTYLKKIGVMAGSAVLAAGCSAVLLLPAFLNLKNGQNALWDIPVSFELRYGISEMFSKLIPGVYDSLTDAGLPNIYFSVFGLLAALAFFFNKGIGRREKIVFGAFAALMLLCMSCDILDLAWHAFEDPTWYPARYSFVFSFLGLYLGLRCAEKHKDIKGSGLVAVSVIILAVFTEIATKRYHYIDVFSVCLGMFFAVAYAILTWHLFKRKRRGVVIALIALLCAELWYNAHGIILGIDNQFEYKTRQSYVDYRETYAPALAVLPQRGAGAYRTEIREQRNANGAMALGYNSISHYSTTTNQKINTLLRGLAYNTGTLNEVRFAPGSPLAAGLLGIKYVLSNSKDDMGSAYTEYDRQGSVVIYENSLAFPLAFYTGSSATGPGDGETNPFTLQNAWCRNLWDDVDQDPFELVDAVELKAVNLAYEDRESGQQYYTKAAGDKPAYVEWTIDNGAGEECYAYFGLYKRRFSRVKVYVNGYRSTRVLAYRSNAIIPLGRDDSITLRLELEGDTMNFDEAFFYTLDKAAAQELTDRANANQMNFTVFKDTRVEGTLTAPDDGVLVTTIPYDKGWTIEVN